MRAFVFFAVIGWRFFSGAHLNGDTYNDATWWRDASPIHRKRRMAYTWWRRKARIKRAAWRNCVFWPVMLITWGLVFYTFWSMIALGIIAVPFAYYCGRKLRLALWLPIVARNTDGSVMQHWVLKPRVSRVIRSVPPFRGLSNRGSPKERKRPGLALKSELQPGIHLEEIPADYERAVRMELAEELDGQPLRELKLLMAPDDE